MSRLVVQSSLLWKTCIVLQLLQGLVASKDEFIIDDSRCFKQLLSIIKFNYYTSYKSYQSYQHLSVLSVSQYLHHPCSPCRSVANLPCLDPNSIDIIGPVPQLGEMYIWNTKWRKYCQEIMGVPTVPISGRRRLNGSEAWAELAPPFKDHWVRWNITSSWIWLSVPGGYPKIMKIQILEMSEVCLKPCEWNNTFSQLSVIC